MATQAGQDVLNDHCLKLVQMYFDIVRSQQMTHSSPCNNFCVSHYSLTFLITILSDFDVYLNLFLILFSTC